MDNHQASNKKTIGSVVKAVEIIDMITASEHELGATEISHQLGLNVSGIYHILNTLKECNMIEQNPQTKKYRLGLKLWKIGQKAGMRNQLGVYIQPYLTELRDATNETANLTVLDNHEIVYIAQEESNRFAKMFTKMGAKAPVYCSGAGKVLLAYQTEEIRNSILSRVIFHKYTEKTILDAQTLEQELETIRRNGYAFDDEEREEGVSCIAAPIFDFDNEVIAAMSISGPTTRFRSANRDAWIEEILHITRKISQRMGHKKM